MAPQPRVLVIDDDPSFRQLMDSLLKPHYLVALAESGEEGYQLANERPPHIVLIDVDMPGWDGLQTLQKFQEEAHLSGTRTAIVTGDATRKTVVTAIQHGTDEYIVKNKFSKEDLFRKLQKLVARSSLPLEDEPEEKNKVSDSPQPVEAAAVKSAEAGSGNEGEPRIQEMIDDWE